eukprot:185355-Hanusia_phi.AAC.3
MGDVRVGREAREDGDLHHHQPPPACAAADLPSVSATPPAIAGRAVPEGVAGVRGVAPGRAEGADAGERGGGTGAAPLLVAHPRQGEARIEEGLARRRLGKQRSQHGV